MTQVIDPTQPRRLGPIEWLIIIIASIGFMFDIYELLMLPLIAGPALNELVGAKPGSPEFKFWVSLLFYVPAFVGGSFGLVGGYLTDLLGRRRVLTWSILIYAFSALAAGFSTNIVMLLILRCTTFAGFCIEFVAAVAWLAELFPHPIQRERILGYTQAFSSLGGLAVAMANEQIATFATSLPPIFDGHSPWRYTLISGVIPAIPLIIIRPFLPESPTWKKKRDEGTLKRPSIKELFQPALARTTIITTLMFACSYGAAFGAIQQFPEIVKGLPGIKELPTGAPPKPPAKPAGGEKTTPPASEKPATPPAAAENAPSKTAPEAAKSASPGKPKSTQQKEAARAQQWQEWGGLLGRVALAFLAVRIVSRRLLIRLFQIPGLIAFPIIFGVLAVQDLTLAKWGIAVAGFLTVAQFSFWGNYLPRVYPVHLRGTGQSFAANVGGRMLGVLAAPIALSLSGFMSGPPTTQLAMAAAVVGTSVYFLGLILSFFMPEPSETGINE